MENQGESLASARGWYQAEADHNTEFLIGKHCLLSFIYKTTSSGMCSHASGNQPSAGTTTKPNAHNE